jgi:lambda family phage portal protein
MAVRVAKPTLVDRVVGYFAPGLALAMLRDRTMLSAFTGQGGYKGGKRDRRATRNWHPGGGSADADLLPQLSDLRGRSRDLARNLPVATGAVQTNKTHVIGEGLTLNAQCNRKVLGLSEEEATAWNEAAEAEWSIFCRTADFTTVQHLADLQAMIFGGVLESGDIFAIRRYRRDAGDAYGTKVQVIEADMVCNPNWTSDTDTLVAGIEHTRQGVPVAIHVTDRHPGDYRRPAVGWRRVPMRYNDGRQIVLHLFDRLRATQTRGIPYLAPVIEALKSLGDYTDAEVRAAVVSAMFTVFVKGAPAPDSGPLASSGAGGADGRDEIELGAGAVVDLAADEEIQIANPGRPNPQFDAFVTAFLRQIGVALELPFELLIKHFTASYSASRAALEMAYHSFRRRRSWFVRQFMEPVYGWFLEEAILTGRLEAPGFFDDPRIRSAWMRATWTGPVRISLDPKKDAEADKIDVEMRVKTRQQVLTERTGGDFDQKVEQARREEAALDGLAGPGLAESMTAPPENDDPDDEEEDEA